MGSYTDILFDAKDTEYANFQSTLIPNIKRENIIGVRVPILRKMAHSIYKNSDYADFTDDVPHNYYDENMLHSMIISEIKDYETCIKYVDEFLPFVDNWAVCDSISPKCFKKNKNGLLEKIYVWTACSDTYTFRFGVRMLMNHLLDEDFKIEYLEIPLENNLEDYYAKMMVAWFFATALAKQWESTVTYIESERLEIWTHNKAIQKARESFRVSDEHKKYLLTLKRN